MYLCVRGIALDSFYDFEIFTYIVFDQKQINTAKYQLHIKSQVEIYLRTQLF